MQQRHAGTQGLVFGGLMAALVVIFSLVPMLAIFMPIPLVLAYVRYGGRAATLTAIVATIFTMAFSGFIAGLLAIPGGILPGLVFGYGFRHKWRPIMIGLLAVVVFFLGFAMTYGITRVAMLGGRDPIAASLEEPTVKAQLVRLVDQFEQVMVPQVPNPTPAQEQAIRQNKALIEGLRNDPVGVTWSLLPASLFVLGVISSWLNYALCRLTLPRFGHPVPEPTPFAEFRLPLWLVLAFGTLMMGTSYFVRVYDVVSLPWWQKLLLNIASPLSWVVVFAGIAVVYGILRQRKLNKATALLVIVMAFTLLGAIALQLLMVVAMWDAIFDFRGLGHGTWRKRPEERT